MTATGSLTKPLRPVGPARNRHYGAWRAAASVPAMVGSFLLLAVLFGAIGRWEGLVLLGWLASGVLAVTPVGERIAVRCGCGFRRPTATQAGLLGPAWSAALGRARMRAGDVDLYVQRSGVANAYSAGGRSVAVTTGALKEFAARRLGEDQLAAVLVHELGHHATRATRFALITMWLGMPWRVAARAVVRLTLRLAGRQPIGLLAIVVLATMTVATLHAVRHGQMAVAATLLAVVACGVGCPLVDAAVSRRSEYAADRFTASHGLGPALASALQVMQPAPGGRRDTWASRAVSRHPDIARRTERLERGTSRPQW